MQTIKLIATLLFIVTTTALAQTNSRSANDLFEGRQKTNHTVSVDAVIDATPQAVYRLWTTADGVKKFFAPAARIGATAGAEYTIVFSPDRDPQGLLFGTKGARILALSPGNKISFEWITFAGDPSQGKDGPPFVPADIRNVSPLPTWVEITLEPTDSGQKTTLHFRHYGFKEGEVWDESFQWFSRVWPMVIESLQKYCTQM
ncbi:MAG TPA: SRPBCC domain-containing protein [Pyrinomonadaceae bacterium]|nr:SRPBCC domain-containing protein [Pyrinomonadaceae bacterium]